MPYFQTIIHRWHQVNGPTKECVVENGLVVTGTDVIAYGLAVEHTTRDLVQWLGAVWKSNFRDLRYCACSRREAS